MEIERVRTGEEFLTLWIYTNKRRSNVEYLLEEEHGYLSSSETRCYPTRPEYLLLK